MTILWEPDRDRAVAELASLEAAGEAHAVDNVNDLAAWLDHSADERVVVIGADVPFDEVTTFAGHLHATYPEAVIVLVRHPDEHDIAAEALAAGIVEVVGSDEVVDLGRAHARAVQRREELSDDADIDDVDDVDTGDVVDNGVDDVPVPDAMAVVEAGTASGSHAVAEPDTDDNARAQGSESGDITVVFSAKGGSGKTVVSTNLALALARNGARTCLVDLDLEFGDVAVCLQLAPARNIADGASLDLADDASVAALVTTHDSRLDCVLAPINPGDAERVPVRVVTELLAQLRRRYDHIVVDTPSQLSEHVLEVFDAAQHHVLVTTPEIPALKNTRLTLDMFELLGYAPSSRHVLVNRADPKVGLSSSDVQRALDTTIATELPATNEVPKSINSGVPMMLAAPQHQFSVALREFATQQIANDLVAPKRRRRLLSLGQGRAS